MIKVEVKRAKSNILSALKTKLRELREEFKAIKDTPDPEQDVYLSATRGAVFSGISALTSGDPLSVPGSALGGYVGVKVGEKTGDIKKALLASGIIGGVSSSLLPVLILSISGAPISLPLIGWIGLISGVRGSISALSGTLTGLASKELKDTGQFGFKTSALASAIGVNLAGAPTVAAQVPNLFETTDKKKTLMALGLGALLGALVGIPLGPIGMVLSSALSSALALVNLKVATPFESFLRKLQRRISTKIYEKLSGKFTDLSRGKKVAIAGVVGAIGSALSAIAIGSLLGPLGAAAVIGISSIATALSVNKALKMREKEAELLSKIRDSLLRGEKADKLTLELIKLRLKAQKYSDEEVQETIKGISPEELRKISFTEAIALTDLEIRQAIERGEDSNALSLIKEREKLAGLFSGFSLQEVEGRLQEVPDETWKKILENTKRLLSQRPA